MRLFARKASIQAFRTLERYLRPTFRLDPKLQSLDESLLPVQQTIADPPYKQRVFKMAEPTSDLNSTELNSAKVSPGLSSHAPDEERSSPPRKRPRTKAPLQTTSTNTDVVAFASPPTSQLELQTPSQPTYSDKSLQLHHFPIQPLNRFQGASASIKRPREIAHFSYDDNHEYRDDESSINYYVPPPMGADLKEGFNTFKHYEDKEDPHLDSLLRALVCKESKSVEGMKIKADFVTWRGMMTKVS